MEYSYNLSEVSQMVDASEKWIKEWIKNNPYDNGGALNNPPISYEMISDGDEIIKVVFPYVGYNYTWRKSIFRAVQALEDESPYYIGGVFLEPDFITMLIYVHRCDPD